MHVDMMSEGCGLLVGQMDCWNVAEMLSRMPSVGISHYFQHLCPIGGC